MTTHRYAHEMGAALDDESGPGERLRRLQRKRRLLHEELLAVLFLLIALAATVAVLATQWLESGTSSGNLNLPTPSAITYISAVPASIGGIT